MKADFIIKFSLIVGDFKACYLLNKKTDIKSCCFKKKSKIVIQQTYYNKGVFHSGIIFSGTIGKYHFNGYYLMLVLAESNLPNYYNKYRGSAANHHYIYENIANVSAGNESITTNALEGMKVVDIIERVYQINEDAY